jgi:hypothetical protein
VKLFRGKGFHVVFENESEELSRAMECLLQCHSCLRVEYEERILFLTPFVHLLVSRNEGARLYGFRALANTLHLLIDFMDADGSGHMLSARSIEKELYMLCSELYPKD